VCVCTIYIVKLLSTKIRARVCVCDYFR